MKRLALLFYTRKSKQPHTENLPLYVRITMGTSLCDLSTKRTVAASRWNAKAQKAIGTSEDIRSLNAHLKHLERTIFEAYQDLQTAKEEVTIEQLKRKLKGESNIQHSLKAIFEEHNYKLATLLGKEYAAGTLQRYQTTLKHLSNYVQHRYNKDDMEVGQIDYEFIIGFDYYLRTMRHCNNNSAVKYVKNFKKIIRQCLAQGWISKDPFLNYKARVKEVVREFLSEEELEQLASKKIAIERLSLVRDIFLFSCFTGLAYIDVKILKRSSIGQGVDGDLWIFTKRRKSEIPSRIPLLPRAKQLLQKYESHPYCQNTGAVLPVFSNQKMNAYLKEVGDLCGIQKNLTFHMARHTFATTITLSNGVPIESVSKMLGHTNLTITQHYAKILDQKISSDMAALKKKWIATDDTP